MEPTLYLVRMSESAEDGDLGPSTQIVVQLSDIDGKWFADFRQNSWAYANHALLKGLKEKGLRFLGSLPNLDRHRPAYDNSFWIVTEPLSSERRVVHRRDHDGY